jgi:hypothetical protein
MAEELEFVKLLVRPVIQRRVDGKVVAEVVNDEVAIFDVREVGPLVVEIERQIGEINAAQKPNRAARRTRKSDTRRGGA